MAEKTLPLFEVQAPPRISEEVCHVHHYLGFLLLILATSSYVLFRVHVFGGLHFGAVVH